MSTPKRAATSGSTGGSLGNSLVGDLWVNLTRWNRKAVRNPTAFFLEIIVALFSLVLFTAVFGEVGEVALTGAGFGDVDYVTFLLPAVFMQATMGSLFTSGIGLVGETSKVGCSRR